MYCIVDFLAAVCGHVRSIDPQLPVGVILTSAAVLEDQPWHQPILEVSDFAGYNYYALNPDVLSVLRDETTVRGQLRELIRAARGLPILIQEFGVPTGLDGVTEAEQAEIARFMYEEIYDHPRVRWVSWFKMTDFSQAFADAYGQLFIDEGQPLWWVNRFKAWLRGSGVCVYETGQTKQSWQTFLSSLDRVALDVEGLSWSSASDLWWESVDRAETYDVSRGSLGAMASGRGVSDAGPLACGQPANMFTDSQSPAAGGGFYYLIRARDGATLGSWGLIARDSQVTACD